MSNEDNTSMDPNALFREENYTDQKMGAIRKLTPVDANGDEDQSRDVLFFGSAQGPTIGAAATDFAAKAAIAVEEAAKELEQMRRDQASQIVMPGQGGGMGGPPSGGIIT
jgi:hypothetical protein